MALRYPNRPADFSPGALHSSWPRCSATRSWSSSSSPPAPPSVSRTAMGRACVPTATALRVRHLIRTDRCLGRDTALCCAASGGHSATIAALVFAGADGDVSNNDGYSTRRGSAWVQSLHAFGLGRQTADELAEKKGTLAEYEEAVRKVRLVQQSTGRAKGLCRLGAAPGLWPREAVGLPGLTRASAYRVGVPIISLGTGRRGRALPQSSTQQRACCVSPARAAVRATD